MGHIHVGNQVVEKFAEHTKPLYGAFIDYEKAFDSVFTAAVLKAFKYKGIEENFVRLLDDICKECTSRIFLQKQSDKFPSRKGVIQGTTISPKLFTACLEAFIEKLDWENLGLRINRECLSHLRFADYIV